MRRPLTGLPDLLASLDEAERPTGSLQLMSAERPFEPNPTVPTLVYGLDSGGAWASAAPLLRLAFPAGHSVRLLGADGRPEAATLDALGDEAPAAEAVYLPPVEPVDAARSLQGLRYLVHRLRAPGGCPWDREQTHESLVRYVIEEAYEVADAIRHEGPSELAEELGDLLLQVFLQAELAEEAGQFTLNDVVEKISAKLVRRHPHVFADPSASSGQATVKDAREVQRNWDELKRAEKGERTSALDGVPKSLPALLAAQEIQRRMKKVGFDWPDRRGVDAKLDEELAELKGAPPDTAADELGDVLFILARLGLELGADAEEALRAANARLSARFRHVEARTRADGRSMKDMPLAELLSLWDEAKAAEPR